MIHYFFLKKKHGVTCNFGLHKVLQGCILSDQFTVYHQNDYLIILKIILETTTLNDGINYIIQLIIVDGM